MKLRRAWHVVAIVLLAGCENPSDEVFSTADVAFIAQDGTPVVAGAEIPYRGGGQFAVRVHEQVSSLEQPMRATAEIVMPWTPAGAITSATFNLVRQPDGAFSGSGNLVWPPGGPVNVRVHAAGQSQDLSAPLALPKLVIDFGSISNNGSQQTIPMCIESSAPDGTVNVHLDGAAVQGGSQQDASLTLVRGPCLNIAPSDPALLSHAQLTVTASKAFQVTATLANTLVVLQQRVPLQSASAALTLTSPSGAAPAPLSIVEIDAHAELGGAPAANVPLQVQATSAVVFVPAAPSTDSSGNAVIRFQMPEQGPVHVEVAFASSKQAIDFQ